MIKVRDCFRTISKGVDLVSPEASVEEVIASVTQDPASRAVFVVDKDGKIVFSKVYELSHEPDNEEYLAVLRGLPK